MKNEKTLTSLELAAHLGLPDDGLLRTMRWLHKGPRYFKDGRSVGYLRSDIKAYEAKYFYGVLPAFGDAKKAKSASPEDRYNAIIKLLPLLLGTKKRESQEVKRMYVLLDLEDCSGNSSQFRTGSAEHATHKKEDAKSSGGESDESLIRILTKLVKTSKGALPSISIRDLKRAMDWMNGVTKRLRSILSI